ncbi:hypothetical protein HDU98_000618 [Podochytrium sp. JEL0797]|nr:hypothetical protein HDU98_000618 [Podochytrium sp. JEL0797]
MGPQTYKFFKDIYAGVYELDEGMTCGHELDFSRQEGEEPMVAYSPSDDTPLLLFDATNVSVGDFVELCWEKEKPKRRVRAARGKRRRKVRAPLSIVEDDAPEQFDGLWIARVTAVHAANGIRIVNLYAPSQTILGRAGNDLGNWLFQTSECNCKLGWLGFDAILRKVRVSYSNEPSPDHYIYSPRYYDVDETSFLNMPPEFTAEEEVLPGHLLCDCPDTENVFKWPVYRRDLTEEQMEASWPMRNGFNLVEEHAIVQAKKRKWVVGTFFTRSAVLTYKDVTHAMRVDSREGGKSGGGCDRDEVFEVVGFYPETKDEPPVLTVRLFERMDGTVNGLVRVDELTDWVGWKEICRVSDTPCFVEYSDGQSRSLAVEYQGAGRRFFIRTHAELYPVKGLEPRNKRIIDLFSGAGNLSKGIAESGLGDPTIAIDNCAFAVKSFNVMHKKPDTVSEPIAQVMDVNDFLKEAARNYRESGVKVAADWAVLGPSCQSFSMLNRYPKVNGRAVMVEAAHVAECLGYLDGFIIENVTEFARKRSWPEETGDGTMFESHFFENGNAHLNGYIKPPAGCGDPRSGAKPVLSAPCRRLSVRDRIGDLPSPLTTPTADALPFHVKSGTIRGNVEYLRINPNGLFSTIAKNPIQNVPRYHWTEDRLLTLYERARAQGFLKEDLVKLWKAYGGTEATPEGRNHLARQVGNAVPRELAFAIGCAIQLIYL